MTAVLRLRVTPNAGRDVIEGYETLADGTTRTRTLTPAAGAPVAVTGYPHDGADGPSVSFRINVAVAP